MADGRLGVDMRRTVDRAITDLWAGMPAETILIRLLTAIREQDDSTHEEES